jgi:hypothetical protein
MFSTLRVMRTKSPIPRSVAQLAGLLVTAIVVLGTNMDAAYSVPLGVCLGALAMFLISFSEQQNAYCERWERE